jgi:hypothetical protein
MSRTQLLASVVDVEPLAISSTVVEPDDDDGYEEEDVEDSEEEEEDQKHSFENEIDEEQIEEEKEDQVTHTPMPVDPHDLQLDLATILQCIRFPMMPPDYLANRVESDSFIMSIDGMKDMVKSFKIMCIIICSTNYLLLSYMKLINIMLWLALLRQFDAGLVDLKVTKRMNFKLRCLKVRICVRIFSPHSVFLALQLIPLLFNILI